MLHSLVTFHPYLNVIHRFIVTISAWTQPGCKNPDNDPSAEDKGDDFKKGLDGWCSTKKAGAIFFWLAFGKIFTLFSYCASLIISKAFWAASLVLLVLDWRSGKLHAPRDPPFTRPESIRHDEEDGPDDDEDASYTHIPPVRQSSTSNPNAPGARYDNSDVANSPFSDTNRYNSSPSYTPAASAGQPIAASRPSMDAYGAFSDPAPSGFAAPSGFSGSPAGGYATPPQSGYATPPGGFNTASPARTNLSGAPALPEIDMGPRVSRTMQYADPYAAVRASIAGQQGQGSPTSGVPPSYESYQGYR